jgi:hypothetical protein
MACDIFSQDLSQILQACQQAWECKLQLKALNNQGNPECRPPCSKDPAKKFVQDLKANVRYCWKPALSHSPSPASTMSAHIVAPHPQSLPSPLPSLSTMPKSLPSPSCQPSSLQFSIASHLPSLPTLPVHCPCPLPSLPALPASDHVVKQCPCPLPSLPASPVSNHITVHQPLSPPTASTCDSTVVPHGPCPLPQPLSHLTDLTTLPLSLPDTLCLPLPVLTLVDTSLVPLLPPVFSPMPSTLLIDSPSYLLPGPAIPAMATKWTPLSLHIRTLLPTLLTFDRSPMPKPFFSHDHHFHPLQEVFVFTVTP